MTEEELRVLCKIDEYSKTQQRMLRKEFALAVLLPLRQMKSGKLKSVVKFPNGDRQEGLLDPNKEWDRDTIERYQAHFG